MKNTCGWNQIAPPNAADYDCLKFDAAARVSGEEMLALKAVSKQTPLLSRLLKSVSWAAGDDGLPPPAGFSASDDSSMDAGGGGCFIGAVFGEQDGDSGP